MVLCALELGCTEAQHVLKAALISAPREHWKLIQWVLRATAPPIQSQHILGVPRFRMAAEKQNYTNYIYRKSVPMFRDILIHGRE